MPCYLSCVILCKALPPVRLEPITKYTMWPAVSFWEDPVVLTTWHTVGQLRRTLTFGKSWEIKVGLEMSLCHITSSPKDWKWRTVYRRSKGRPYALAFLSLMVIGGQFQPPIPADGLALRTRSFMHLIKHQISQGHRIRGVKGLWDCMTISLPLAAIMEQQEAMLHRHFCIHTLSGRT